MKYQTKVVRAETEEIKVEIPTVQDGKVVEMTFNLREMVKEYETKGNNETTK